MKTQSALCASAIKAQLKKEFPAIKFSVRSDNFSMGDSVNISYQDGVPVSMVEAVTDKFQYGSFDGMTDCYISDNRNDLIPQTKYISIRREMSDGVRSQILAVLLERFPGFNPDAWNEDFRCWGDTLVHREFWQMKF